MPANAAITRRVLICPDTFKGTLSSLGVTRTIRDALLSSSASSQSQSQSRLIKLDIDVAPMSDGGAGLLDSLLNGCKGLEAVSLDNVTGPLGVHHRITTRFAVHKAHKYAVVEMAEASGLPLVDKKLKEIAEEEGNVASSSSSSLSPITLREKDPRYTTSFGTGQIMAHIASHYTKDQIERIYVGIGGSSTNECGLGALQALGLGIYVKGDGNESDGDCTAAIPKRLDTPFMGKDLTQVVSIDANTNAFRAFCDRFPGKDIILLCDVSNPLLGPHGATYVYGPQKGAKGQTPSPILDELEKGMANVAAIINTHLEGEPRTLVLDSITTTTKANAAAADVVVVRDIGTMKGAGGAGGMSGGFFALLGAQWQSGAEVLREVFLRLDERIDAADVIITGEGRFDEQTIQYGKTVASLYKTMLMKRDKSSKQQEEESEGSEGTTRSVEETQEENTSQKKMFVVVCGVYQGPQMEGASYVPSLSVEGRTAVHAFALSPTRFPSEEAMANTAACLRKMVSDDIAPLLLKSEE